MPLPHYSRYFVGNHSLGSTTDTEDFGLDVYEPWFQRSQEDWLANQEDGGSYNVKLIITDANTAELFYFCHVHGKVLKHDACCCLFCGQSKVY